MTPEQLSAATSFVGVLSVPVALIAALVLAGVRYRQLIAAVSSYTSIAASQASINASTRQMIEAQHEGLIAQRDQLDALTSLTEALTQSVNLHSLNFEGMSGELNQQRDIINAAVEAASAAQRFYDAAIKRERFSDDDLKSLGRALAQWAHKGRAN